MSAALRARNGVDLIDDHRIHIRQNLPRLGRQHQIQALRSGDQNIRRLTHLPAALSTRRIPRSHTNPHFRHWLTQTLPCAPDTQQRRTQVILHIHPQCLQRRYIQNPHTSALACRRRGRRGVDKRQLPRCRHQRIQCPQKRRQRLTRTSRSNHQCVLTSRNDLPRLLLNWSRGGENTPKPLGHWRAKTSKHTVSHTSIQPNN